MEDLELEGEELEGEDSEGEDLDREGLFLGVSKFLSSSETLSFRVRADLGFLLGDSSSTKEPSSLTSSFGWERFLLGVTNDAMV